LNLGHVDRGFGDDDDAFYLFLQKQKRGGAEEKEEEFVYSGYRGTLGACGYARASHASLTSVRDQLFEDFGSVTVSAIRGSSTVRTPYLTVHSRRADKPRVMHWTSKTSPLLWHLSTGSHHQHQERGLHVDAIFL
jgi:hypothetical protein